MSTHALLETVCISLLNFNLFLAVFSSAHPWCYNYIWAIGSTVFQLVRKGERFSACSPTLWSGADTNAALSCDEAYQAGHPAGCNFTEKYCLVKVQQQRNLPWLQTLVMKKLHYKAVLFQMFHVGIIRNRISKNLMSVSLQVTVNCLCHGSSVKTQRIIEEQLQLLKTSV